MALPGVLSYIGHQAPGSLRLKPISMKKNIIYLLLVVFAFSGCKDEDLKPIITFEDAGKGAFVRLVSLNQDLLIDPSKIATSGIDMEVDFVDVTGGETITDYDIFIRFIDNTPGNGENSRDEVQIRDFTSSDFTASANGNPGVAVQIPAPEILQALNLTEDQVDATDRFSVRSEIIDEQGRVFSSTNSSPPIANFGGAFNGAFDYNINVACPVGDDFMVGTYTVTYEENGASAFGGPVMQAGPFEVTLSATSSTQREFTAIYAEDLGFGTNISFQFDLLCDKTRTLSGLGTGLGCGGTITFGPTDDFGSMDLADDSEIIIPFVEGEDDGGCGISPPVRHVIKLTKN